MTPLARRPDGGHHVLVLAAATGARCARRPGVGRLGDPGGEVDVVRGEVLDHADVGDPRPGTGPAAGGDLVDLAEVARPRSAARSAAAPGCSARCGRRRRRGRPRRTPQRAARPPRRCRRSASRSSCARRPRPAPGRPPRGGRSGTATMAEVDAGVDQCLDVGQHRAGRRRRRAGRRRGRRRPTRSTPGRRAEHAGVVAAHHAEADQPGAQRRRSSGTRLREGVDRRRRCARGRLGQRRVHRQREHLAPRPARSPAGRARGVLRRTAAGGSGSGSRRREPTLYSSASAAAKPSRSSATRIVYWW